MIAEIIAVGTELLLGSIANTNARDLSRRLSRLGISVYYHTVVGDNPRRLRDTLDLAASRSDIIITTGGLGPTYDDLTRDVVCGYFGVKLVRHEETWEKIQAYFQEMGRQITPNNERQAMLPPECTVFQNDWGTAPGFAFKARGKHVLLLPGPPRECITMFDSCALPYLEKLGTGIIVSRSVRVFGMGESAVEDKLRHLMENAANPTVAPYAKEGEVELRVTARADTREKAFEMTVPVVEKLRQLLPGVIYGVDVDSLEQLLVRKLAECNKTLAVAESCTGGMMSRRITDIPGASRVFFGGVVAYANHIKTSVLGVDKGILTTAGVVSEAMAGAMAEQIRHRAGSDIGVGITGLAGPSDDGLGIPVGTVCIAVSTSNGVSAYTHRLGDERGRIRVMATNHGLRLVLRALDGMDGQTNNRH